MTITEPAYTYRVLYRSNYDGDTIRFDFDLGLGVWNRGESGTGVAVRLYNIDTPELRESDPALKQKAYEARDWVEKTLLNSDEIIVKTIKDKTGKYGRYVAMVYYRLQDGSNWFSLTDELLARNLAEAKEY